ncbi:MlaD family protein [Cytophaga aurantiaca]|uniref:MlaD family protein n=1 Tax=Cytophaga aurantiaca TaxID=29530 RepID=UPI000381431F|nr:MlaD family protein [Cytophaga aurantiaca]
MKESPNKRAVIVGMFVLVGILILLAGILTVGNLHTTFTKKMKITAVFDDVNGLLPGSNIWYSGVKIGTVKSLQFYGKSQVEVEMNIDQNSQKYIRKDSKVKLGSDGLIGNKILIIYGGTEQAGEIQENDVLTVGVILSTDDVMNTLQQNNKNILAITNDFKIISKRMVDGQGTIGKLMTDESIFNNINATTKSLQQASVKAQELIASLSNYTAKLDDEGTLLNELVTDTVMFKSMSASIDKLQQMADSAAVMVNNLKTASQDPNSTIGVLLHDDASGAHLKATIKNLETSSQKLDEDLELLKGSFLLRGAVKRKEKEEKKKNKQ